MTAKISDIERVNRTLLAPPLKHPAPERRGLLREHGGSGSLNHGGGCMGCGNRLGFWYNTKLCDRCVSSGRSVKEAQRVGGKA